MLKLLFQMTDTVQGTLHEGEISRGNKLCLDTVHTVCGTAHAFTYNFFLDLNTANHIISSEVIQGLG